jgi:exosortase
MLDGGSVSAAEFEVPRVTIRGHLAYAAVAGLSVLIYSKELITLVMYAWNHDSSSQILLIPVISSYFVWLDRKRIFAVTRFSMVPGATLILSGGVLFWIGRWDALHLRGNETLCVSTLSILVIWTGAFLLCYGAKALRAAAFPLLFLLFMIPIPDRILDGIIRLLQQGSTEVAWLIFKTAQLPVFRQGFVLSVPGVTIEVAKECSSIRSSMALLITCILVAHLYLRTWWKALLFVLLSLPLSVIKNGIRIATLTLLSLYVNPDFLRGNLHRDGGFVFFFLALLALWPIFVLLEKSEHRRDASLKTSPRAEATGRG